MSAPRRPVIVAYDGSDESRAALLWALHDTAPDGVVLPVAVLGHEPSPVPGLSRLPGAPEERSHVARRIAGAWDEDGAELRDIAELRFEHGHPAEVLAAVAEREDAAMIVVGHHRGRRLQSLRPSVAEDLLRKARCPVVVVP